MDQPLTRQYVLLRCTTQGGAGFARLEQRHGHGTVILRLSRLTTDAPLRALLLSGTPDTGSVLDVGTLQADAAGRANLYRDHLPLPRGFGCYHTLAVAADWPHPALLFHGPLSAHAMPLWQLREAVQRYLSVPQSCPGEAAPVPAPRSVMALPTLIWPEPLSSLQTLFEMLPPFAPFDAPGWRFVRAPLPDAAPAPYCAVGIQRQGGRLLQVAYALPGTSNAPPSIDLAAYHWLLGRHGQGYWLTIQQVLGSYADERMPITASSPDA